MYMQLSKPQKLGIFFKKPVVFIFCILVIAFISSLSLDGVFSRSDNMLYDIAVFFDLAE